MPGNAGTLERWVMAATERQQGELPAFPAVAARVVALLEQPEVDVRRVEELIRQDQVIMAHVIRAANSVLFGGAVPIVDVGQAVVRLGLRETADVAMTAAARCLFDVENRMELEVFPEIWRGLWHDSLVCGYGARLIARELKRGDPEEAFLGGMFRNLGSLLVLKIVARGRVTGRLLRAPTLPELAQVCERLHPLLGPNYLRRCHLPEAVSRIAELHHAAELPEGLMMPSLHVVRFADGLCEENGTAPFGQGIMGAPGEQSAAILGITPGQREYFRLQLQELAEQVRIFL